MSDSKKQGPEESPLEDHVEQHVSLSTAKFTGVITSICLLSFFIGFDSTCVGTITPIITDDFNSPGDVGWYGTAYLLASCSTILSWGKLYSFYPEKIVLGISIGIFVLGSILCAVSQSSPVFILGRTIAGLGNGGVLSGYNIVITRITPLARRPLYFGFVGGVECLAISLAPVLAGIIARYSTWRVCFYISIPIGVISMLVVLTLMDLPKTALQSSTSARQKLEQLDLPGIACFFPSVICLILALQWGGTTYPWSDSRIIVLLVLFGALAVAFAVEQYFANAKSTATVPVKILRSPTILLVVSYAFTTGAALNLYEYYIPIFYQAVQGLSTLGSGLRDLGRMIGLSISLLLVGAITGKIGFYNPAMIVGTSLMCIGTGLTTTFGPSTTAVVAIIYQTILGVGCGLAFQQPIVAAQAVLPQALVPSAIVLVSFSQSLGSIISLAVAQNLFRNRLLRELTTKLPTIQPDMVLNSGILDLKNLVPPGDLDTFLDIYSDSLRNTYFVGLGFACASVIGAFCTPWKSLKAEPKNEEAQSAQEQIDAQNVDHKKKSTIEV